MATLKSPVDENELEEFFGEEIGITAIPEDDEIEVNIPERTDLPAALQEALSKWLNHNRLRNVVLSLEFRGQDGISNWVTYDFVTGEDTDYDDSDYIPGASDEAYEHG